MKSLRELSKVSQDDIRTVSGAMDSIEAYINSLLDEISERDDMIDELEADLREAQSND